MGNCFLVTSVTLLILRLIFSFFLKREERKEDSDVGKDEVVRGWGRDKDVHSCRRGVVDVLNLHIWIWVWPSGEESLRSKQLSSNKLFGFFCNVTLFFFFFF